MEQDAVADGYGLIAGGHVLLEALNAKPGGMDFTLHDREGAQVDTLRVTRGAMGPVTRNWLVYDWWDGELWMADDTANAVCLALG